MNNYFGVAKIRVVEENVLPVSTNFRARVYELFLRYKKYYMRSGHWYCVVTSTESHMSPTCFLLPRRSHFFRLENVLCFMW